MITIPQLASSVLIAVVVAYTTHYLTTRRDLKNRRQEQRVSYLIAAYHAFSSVCNRDRTDNNDKIVLIEQAIASIKLLGSRDQIRLVQRLETEIVSHGGFSAGDLLGDLRDSLRKELGLMAIDFDTPPIHIHQSKTGS